MKKALTIALAAALSTAPLGGLAFAQTTNSTTPMAATSAMTDDMVTVVIISDQTPDETETQQIPEMYKNATPETAASAQTEIKSDPALLDILTKKNVQIENVVGVQTAASGGKIVYVK